jgi:hypothetical protein
MGGIPYQTEQDIAWFFFGGVVGSRDGGLNYCGICGVTHSGTYQNRNPLEFLVEAISAYRSVKPAPSLI